jgi:hypothetical protein
MNDRDQLWELMLRIRSQVRILPGQDDELALHGVVLPAGLAKLAAGERADYAVCLPLDREHPLELADNRRGRCSACNCRIQFRPSLPKRLPRLCIGCALRIARGSDA